VDIVIYKLQLDSSSIATCLEDRLLLQHLKNSEKTKLQQKEEEKRYKEKRCYQQEDVASSQRCVDTLHREILF
jgi:hypothetical protein